MVQVRRDWFQAAINDACNSFARISAGYLFGFWICSGLGVLIATGSWSDWPHPAEIYLFVFRAVGTIPGFIAFFLTPVSWYSALHRRDPRPVLIWWGLCMLLWVLAGLWVVWTHPQVYWPEQYQAVDDWFTPFFRTLHLQD